MSKYAPLGEYLRRQPMSEIQMSFEDIERVVGTSLPNAKQYPAWWSNNPFNNVMTKVWLEAGFKTERVDVRGQQLVFRRVAADDAASERPNPAASNDRAPKRHPIFGALRGLVVIPEGVDLTEPADPTWADIVEEKGA